MLGISLMRLGAKKKPFYRLVVKEKRSKRDGKYLENLGTYNPMMNPALVDLKHERIEYWISVGAQPTETVASLIKHNPQQTEEEKAATVEAREAKKAADRQALLDAKKAAAEAKRAEEEKAAADKAAAEKAEADAAAAAAQAEAEENAASAESDNAEAVATDEGATTDENQTAPSE